jgi:hypothetical protein
MATPRILGLIFLVLMVLAVGRIIWSIYRIVWRNELMESGGPMGPQTFGRSRDRKPPAG